MRKNQIDLGLTYMSSAIKKIEKEIIPALMCTPKTGRI